VPNPFNATVDLYMNATAIASSQHAALRIFDVSGRMVREYDLTAAAFGHTPKVTWDGTDGRGLQVARGIYFCELVTDKHTVMEKIIYVR
jgi:flagellar hook assembly protein FlgD